MSFTCGSYVLAL
uniref:Uncharacterized protein n=1 Tax=Anguilla anguilla TaxID=7936 RepID=A0A0E9W390_ANGAN